MASIGGGENSYGKDFIMKKTLCSLCALLILALTCLTSCPGRDGDAINDFYVKTPTSGGDVQICAVADLWMESKIYRGEGDLRVRATVGFGRLPDVEGSSDEKLRVEYLIIEAPWAEDKRPSWEMITDYEISWYDEMFDSTEMRDGDFSPIFKEDITLTFPEEVSDGYLEIRLYTVKEGRDKLHLTTLRVHFERKDGVLTIAP